MPISSPSPGGGSEHDEFTQTEIEIEVETKAVVLVVDFSNGFISYIPFSKENPYEEEDTYFADPSCAPSLLLLSRHFCYCSHNPAGRVTSG